MDELNALWLSSDTEGAYALYDSLPLDTQQALEEMMVPVVGEVEIGPLVETVPIAATCWYRTQTFSATNGFGAKVYEMGQNLEWCGSGGAITQANCSAWGQPTAWPFNFTGWTTYCGTAGGGIGWNWVRKFS
ncbi:MAG: hypothetical protein QM589_18895 [Thermomicrobiales bacterium]